MNSLLLTLPHSCPRLAAFLPLLKALPAAAATAAAGTRHQMFGTAISGNKQPCGPHMHSCCLKAGSTQQGPAGCNTSAAKDAAPAHQTAVQASYTNAELLGGLIQYSKKPFTMFSVLLPHLPSGARSSSRILMSMVSSCCCSGTPGTSPACTTRML